MKKKKNDRGGFSSKVKPEEPSKLEALYNERLKQFVKQRNILSLLAILPKKLSIKDNEELYITKIGLIKDLKLKMIF
jgi:hypothetical protein